MKKNQKGFTIVEPMIVICVVAIFAALIVPAFNTSDGNRVGELVKLSNKGIFCKTSEGSLKISEGGGGDSNGLFDFTIQDKALTNEAQALLGKRVKVTYHQSPRFNRCKGDTSYDIVSIVEVPKQ